jgi:hypothetical protein
MFYRTNACACGASHIMANYLFGFPASIGHNPGIAAMWEDEKQRRRDNRQSSQISIPVSQGTDIKCMFFYMLMSVFLAATV